MPPDRASPRSTQAPPPAGRRRILCAFSSAPARQELSSVLTACGYSTATASSILEVLDTVAEGPPDLLLLDGCLGDDELELLRAVRRSVPPGTSIATVLFPRTAPSAELRMRAQVLGVRLFCGGKLGAQNLRSLVQEALATRGAPSEGELLSFCERARSGNPFVALAVASTSSGAEIRRAYEVLCSCLHPGALDEASPELQRVAERALADLKTAYSKVSDPESLSAYRRDPDRDTKGEEEGRTAGQDLHAAGAYRKGQADLERQDWPAALKSFRRAVELAPRDGGYRAFLGWAIYLAHGAEPKALRAAIEHAKRGLKLAPDDFRPTLILGKLYQLTNRLDLAEKALSRAVQTNPDCIEAVRELRIVRTRVQSASPKDILLRRLRRWLPSSLLRSRRRTI